MPSLTSPHSSIAFSYPQSFPLYRPISLLSTLSKILERILNKRLTWFLESNNCLNQAQYGCRRGRSSTMALAELDAHIHTATSNNSRLNWVFFDLENAFPRVWTHLILSTLHSYGLRGLLPNLLQNYLTSALLKLEWPATYLPHTVRKTVSLKAHPLERYPILGSNKRSFQCDLRSNQTHFIRG